jgi:hypothetical protein
VGCGAASKLRLRVVVLTLLSKLAIACDDIAFIVGTLAVEAALGADRGDGSNIDAVTADGDCGLATEDSDGSPPSS